MVHNLRLCRHGNTTVKQYGCRLMNDFLAIDINFVVLIEEMEYTGSSYTGELNNGRYVFENFVLHDLTYFEAETRISFRNPG